MPSQPREFPSFCSLQERYIFVIGGLDFEDEDTDTVERFDIIKGVWETMASLTKPKFNHKSCTLGNSIYVFGGEYYDETTSEDCFDMTIQKLCIANGP